jgi:hypothetical protein
MLYGSIGFRADRTLPFSHLIVLLDSQDWIALTLDMGVLLSVPEETTIQILYLVPPKNLQMCRQVFGFCH